MAEKLPFTRRQFLESSLALMASTASVPAFLARTSQAVGALNPHASGVAADRILVVVQLSGGNDGLNTVIPFGDAAYHNARPTLAVAAKEVLDLNHRQGVGLHPNLRPIHDLVGQGRCSIVQGVGYPNPNRSHFASMDVWHTGDTRTASSSGWIGKALDAQPPGQDAMACMSLGAESPLAVQGKRVKPIAFESADLFRYIGSEIHPEMNRTHQAMQQIPPVGDQASFVYRTALDAQVASTQVRSAIGRRTQTRFPQNKLGRQLESVAKMIQADLPTRVYYTAMGGFDTHANERQSHDRLMGEFASAMAAFDAELNAVGHASRVVTLAFSEFGRRVAQNASQGTDHGAAGPVFVFGSDLKRPGLVGEHPSLTQLDQGDLMYQTDFRQIYAELLDDWMQLDAQAALGKRYPSVGLR